MGRPEQGERALFHFSHSENIVIKNAMFKNVKSSHHVEFAACRDVLVENCRFYNYTGKTSSNNEALQMDVVHNSASITATEV